MRMKFYDRDEWDEEDEREERYVSDWEANGVSPWDLY